MDKNPDTCRTMAELRGLIDTIDAGLVALLARRAACIDRAAVLKPPLGIPARVPLRVEEVVAHVRALAADGFDPDEAEAMWRRLIEWSIAREEAAFTAGKAAE
jgi:isochorismate pyruvate lyase